MTRQKPARIRFGNIFSTTSYLHVGRYLGRKWSCVIYDYNFIIREPIKCITFGSHFRGVQLLTQKSQDLQNVQKLLDVIACVPNFAKWACFTDKATLICQNESFSLYSSIHLQSISQTFYEQLFLPISFCQKITDTNFKYNKAVQNTLIQKSCS